MTFGVVRLADDHTAASVARVAREDVEQLHCSIGARSSVQTSDTLVIAPVLRRPHDHKVLAELVPQRHVQHQHDDVGAWFSGLMNESGEIDERV